jgi:hypothetical protein
MVDVNRLVVLLGIDGLHCRNREMTSVFLNYYCLVKIRFSSLLTSSCVEKIVLEYMCKQVIIFFFRKKRLVDQMRLGIICICVNLVGFFLNKTVIMIKW